MAINLALEGWRLALRGWLAFGFSLARAGKTQDLMKRQS